MTLRDPSACSLVSFLLLERESVVAEKDYEPSCTL